MSRPSRASRATTSAARPGRAAPSPLRRSERAAAEPRPRPGEPGWQQRRERRALSHVGGPIELEGGDARERAALQQALGVSADEARVMRHVHGFHSYPARLHPDTAAALIGALAPPRGSVLDPFSGSGTVAVEARLAGRRAHGSDVNPLAVELGRLKTSRVGPAELERLAAHVAAVVEHAEQRRAARAGPSRPYGPEDRELFDVHVLLELDGLRSGIERITAEGSRRALALVLSSLLTKLSRKPGDTIEGQAPRRLAAGHATRLFAGKAAELSRRLASFAELLPRGAPLASFELEDARALRAVPDASVDLVLCSPPYPGVYDYHAHHALRLRWLGLEDERFVREEIGAKRRLARLDHDVAVEQWRREFGAVLRAVRAKLTAQGRAVFVLADSALGRRALRADELMRALAAREGLQLVARASQARPHFHLPTQAVFERQPKREHVLVLARGEAAPLKGRAPRTGP